MGEKFLIQPVRPKKSKLDNLRKEGIIAVDPDDLVNANIWDSDEWGEPSILDKN